MLTPPRTTPCAVLATVLLTFLLTSCGGGGGGIAVTTPTTPTPPAPTLSFIRFVAQPGNVTAGQTFSVSVELVGTDGARFTSGSNSISLTVGGGAVLGGTTTASAVSGLATFTGISLTKAGTGFQITATSGALTVISSSFSIAAAAVDAAHSVFTPTSFTANVATTLTFTFRDAFANPVPSATVSLATTAAGSTFTPASGTTGTDGTFVTSFRTTSGGSVPLTATVGGVAVPLTATVTSTVGTVNVNIRDGAGALVPQITYTITYPGGSSQFTAATGADVVANVPAGAVSVTANKTGYNTGVASGTLVAGSTLTLNVVMAVATVACNPVPMTFPGSVSGTLTASTCLQGTSPTLFYSFTNGNSQGVHFTLTPTGFSPLLAVTQSPPTQWIFYNQNTPIPVGSLWLLPPGNFQVRAASISGTGTFTLAGTSDAGLLTTATAGGVAAAAAGSCPIAANLLVSMTVTGQSLSSTDCLAADNSNYDAYRLYNSAACTITLTSTAFDAYLEVYDLSTGAFVRSDDDSGGGTNAKLTLTACNNGGNIIEVRANSFAARESGAYTLQIAITGGAATLAADASSRGIQLDRAPSTPRGIGGYLRNKGVKLPK
ncbi:MAG: Ig-like domain-containing protein [Gemmatimonadales bacterium]